jgi:drug/metabolite transporter (DMT)-like permease
MVSGSSQTPASRLQLVIAFATIYIIWGSTYLAIRFAVETLPPFLMMGTRFLIGGAFFYWWVRRSGEPIPTVKQVKSASLIGLLMLVCATGVVGWAEQSVPSGLTALLVSGAPAWFVLIDWLRPKGTRPIALTILGLIVGFIGVIILIGPDKIFLGDFSTAYLIGAGALVFASFSWSFGSILSRHIDMPSSMLTAAAIELLVAGAACVLLGMAFGERVVWEAVSLKSVLSLAFLSVFGAIAFAAFVFLLRATTPSKVSTYAYINPVVAVILGTTLGGETFDARMAIASVVIIGAVILITTAKARKSEPEARSTTVAALADPEIV